MTATRHILSFGAGVNSVALMILLLRLKAPLDEVVFADTGAEVPETYAYLNIAEGYLKEHGVPFRIVSKRILNERDLYQTCWHRRVVPSAVWRWSTRDFKVEPIQNYYRSLGVHICQYIGMAHGEMQRAKDNPLSFITNQYPLLEWKLTRPKCIELIQDAGLPVPKKSGCFFCPFNSKGRWRWIYENHNELYQKAVALEENSKHFPSQRLTDQVFRQRANVTLRELAESFERG